MDRPLTITRIWVATLLAATAVWLYWPASGYDFLLYDDDIYVFENPLVTSGLTMPSMRRAFTEVHEVNWIPLTWLSYMVDTSLFGTSPGGYHLTNIMLHAANVVLVFLLLCRLTGSTGAAAFAAALFGFHPQRLESIVWITERKDVLSTFFGLLALGAYAGYAIRPGRARYLLTAVFLCLSLMAKPMLVTLPLLFLLLDFWPFRRQQPASWPRLLLNKVCFLTIAMAFAAAAYHIQAGGGAVVGLENASVADRIAVSMRNYVSYLWKTAWPVTLSPVYPPVRTTPGEGIAAACLLLLITGWVLASARERPYLVTGWFWFLVALLPVIGLVRVGLTNFADRYSYFASVGLGLAVSMLGRDVAGGTRNGRRAAMAIGLLAMVWLAGLTRWQLHYWHDSESLFRRALQIDDRNSVAHASLGMALHLEGDTEEALYHYQEALRLNPCDGRALNHLGILLASRHELGKAIECFRRAVACEPSLLKARKNLARGYLDAGDRRAALAEFDKILGFEPGNANLRFDRAGVLLALGDYAQAASELKRVVEINPDHAEANNNLAWILATEPDPRAREAEAAMAHARRAAELSRFENPHMLDTLAVACAAAGDYAAAGSWAERALRLIPAGEEAALRARIGDHLKAFREGQGIVELRDQPASRK